MSKHTAGPWVYRDGKIVADTVRPDWATDEDDADERVTVVNLFGAMGGDDTVADGHLLAAGPSLAKALAQIVAAFDEPHYGDLDAARDTLFDAIEQSGARQLLADLKDFV